MNASPSSDVGAAVCAAPRASTRAEHTERNSPPGRFYRPELDGLRFFAFLAVYVDHVLGTELSTQHHHVPNWVGESAAVIGTAGAFGVDLFFVLSAFLITELLLRERRVSGGLDIKAFYARRALRIWPLYFSFLALSYGLTLVVPTERLSLMHLAAFLCFAGNWAYLIKPVTTVAAPLWSVSVEEQFYLVWPWVVRRATRARLAWTGLGVVALGLVARAGLASIGVKASWLAKGSFTRVDGIACGVLLAVWLDGRLPALSAGFRRWLLLASLTTLLVVSRYCGLLDGPTNIAGVTFGWLAVGVAATGIVFSVLGTASPFDAVLANRHVIALGRISYGLYVWHQVGLLVASHLFPDSGARAVLPWCERAFFAFVMTVGLAAFSYRFLERPFIRLKQRRYTVVSSRPEG